MAAVVVLRFNVLVTIVRRNDYPDRFSCTVSTEIALGVRLNVDDGLGLCALPAHTTFNASDVCDAFVGITALLLVNAADLFSHSFSMFGVLTLVDSPVTRASNNTSPAREA